MAISDPSQDAGMSDYCLDPVSDAKHHPDDIKRLSGEPEVAPRLGPKHYGIKMPAR